MRVRPDPLALRLDASPAEVLAAYREEIENMKTYPAYKLRERQLVLEHALEALGHPGNRAMYHDERWPNTGSGRTMG
jgi:hypothetical protein